MIKKQHKKHRDTSYKTIAQVSQLSRPVKRKARRDITVEGFLIWAYQNQCVDILVNRGIGLLKQEKDADGIFYKNISGDGVYGIHQSFLLGTRVDYFGQPTAEIYPDAEILHDLITSKTFNHIERGHLISYGKTGIVPDWLPNAQTMIKPIRRKNGKVRMVHDRNRKPLYCPFEIINPPEHIDFCRRVYNTWHGSLIKLTHELWTIDTMITSFNVHKPAAKKEPWRTK